MKFKTILLSMILFIGGCIEEFNPPSEGYENLLVVDALLTDNPEESVVKLSRSIPLDTTAWIPESGAAVSFSDESGESYRLTEVKEGIYKDPVNLVARSGVSYQLHITTVEGRKYESDFVEMRSTPPIDSVSWRYEEKPIVGLKGVQFYVNTHDPENSTWYYRWQWDETWIFNTAFNSDIYWDGNQIRKRPEDIHTCWKTGESSTIQIATSKSLNEDIIYNYPVLYVDNTTDRLNRRYSLKVKQYALSEQSYNYWKELEKVTENLGTLFDPLPSTINGNIHNVADETEIVLGYFDASTVEEDRTFVDVVDLPHMRLPDYYNECPDTVATYDLIAEMTLRGFELVTERDMGFYKMYIMSVPWCVDCTIAGTNKMPDFW